MYAYGRASGKRVSGAIYEAPQWSLYRHFECLVKCLGPMRLCKRRFRALLNQVVTCFCAGQDRRDWRRRQKKERLSGERAFATTKLQPPGALLLQPLRCSWPATHARATAGVAHITVVRSVTSASISFSSLDGYG